MDGLRTLESSELLSSKVVDVVSLVDSAGRHLWVSGKVGAGHAAAGVSLESIVGTTSWAYAATDEDQHLQRAAFGRALLERVSTSCRFATHTGEAWQVELHPVDPAKPVAVVGLARQVHDDPQLSECELLVTRLTADDHSTAEAAERLEVSESSIRTWLARARRKTGTKTTAGLIAWCVRNAVV